MPSSFPNILSEGVYTPLTTFFKGPDFSLDIETQVKHAKMLHRAGINGVVVAGSIGESIHLTRKERCQIVNSVKEAIPDPGFKVIGGIPQLSIEDTILEIEEYRRAGADFTIILVPGFYGPKLTSQDGIIHFFAAVSDNSKLPIIVYNYPAASNGVDIELATFEKLSMIPNIVAVKLTHFNMDKYILVINAARNNKDTDIKFFTGLGQILLPSLTVGASGAIDGLSGVFPKATLNLMKLFKLNKLDEARELQYLITQVDELVMNHNLVGVKYALKLAYGLGEITSGRPPLDNHMDLKAWKKYEQAFNALLSVEKSL